MRIGFDAKRAFHNRTGLGNYSRSVIRGVTQQLGAENLLLFTPTASQDYGDWRHPNTPLVTAPPFTIGSLWRSRGLGRKLDRFGVDVYHGLSNELPMTIHRSRVRKVVSMHDLIFLRFPDHYPSLDRSIYDRKSRYAVEAADCVVAVSGQTADDLQEYYNCDRHKIRVVYQGCHPAFSAPPSPPDIQIVRERYGLARPFVLNVGSYTERKNQAFLLDVWRTLLDASTDIPELILIGGGSDKDVGQLAERIQALKLGGVVRLLTGVSHADLPHVYKAAEVFLYPSLFEGFGIPLVEALHASLPVIANDIKVLHEAGGPGTVYCGLDAGKWAAAVGDLLNDGDARQRQVERGHQHVSRFDERTMARELVEIYAEGGTSPA